MQEKSYHWYDVHSQEWIEFASKQDMSWPYSDFLPHLSPKATILYLGCGCGRDLIHFQKRGFLVAGLEGSPKLCEIARRQTQTNILHQDFDELSLPPKHYDGIFANAVLMHVSPDKRLNFLSTIYSSLKDGGIFYAHYPKGDKTETYADGRTLHLTNSWPDLAENFLWVTELNEGRPAFVSPEEQNWQVIRYRKTVIND